MLMLKTFLTRQKRGEGVEYPSVICEYVLFPLVNKKLIWPIAWQNRAMWKTQTEIQGEKGWSHGYAR